MSRARPLVADVIGGLVVTALGVGGLVESLRMPRFAERGADPFTVPGLTPGMICIVLTVLGVALILRAMAGRGGATGLPILTWPAGSAARMIFTLVLVAIYGFVLFGRMDFTIATALFIFVFTVGAELLNRERKLTLVPLMLGSAVLAVAASFAIRFLFVEVFLVRLPG